MEFEFDENKSLANKVKHGIDFREIQALWNDIDLLEIPAKNIQDEEISSDWENRKTILVGNNHL